MEKQDGILKEKEREADRGRAKLRGAEDLQPSWPGQLAWLRQAQESGEC